MSVGSIIGGGVRLIRTQPQIVAIWTALYLVGATLGGLALRPLMASMAAAQQQNAANAALGTKPPFAFPAGAFGTLFLLELAFAVLIVIAFAAVVRAVARPEDDRFAYLRVGMDELRLIGLGILLVILSIVAEIVVVLVMGLLAGIVSLTLGVTGAGAIGVIFAIVLFCAAIYAEVRISLAGAFTVLQGRIVIRDAWRATKSHFWTLFVAYFLLGLAYLVITLIIIAMASPQLLSAYAHMDPRAMQAAAQAQYAGQASGFTLGYVVRMILGAVIAVPMGVIMFGSIATAAVELSGVRSSIAAEFE